MTLWRLAIIVLIPLFLFIFIRHAKQMRSCLYSSFRKLKGSIVKLLRIDINDDAELDVPLLTSLGKENKTEEGQDKVEIPDWLKYSLFQTFLEYFPLKTAHYDTNVVKGSKVLLEVISYVYQCSEEEASILSVHVEADNPEETQPEVPVFNTLMILLGFSCMLVSCKPVQGTDVSAGIVRASPFYARRILQKSVHEGKKPEQLQYRDILLAILEWFVSLHQENESKTLLVNICVQLLEATFNCTGRHKEVFEYMVQNFIEAYIKVEQSQSFGTVGGNISKTLNVTEGVKCEGTKSTYLHAQSPNNATYVCSLPMLKSVLAEQRLPRLLFERFLDNHKRDVLFLTIIEPLKHMFKNEYRIYENLENHGVSFWGSLLQSQTKICLPIDDIQNIDNGWTWGAYNFWPVLSREEKFYFTSAENLGKSSRQIAADLKRMKGIPKSRKRPNKLVTNPFYYSSLKCFIESANLPNAMKRSYTHRFLSLCTVDIVVERFGIFAIKQPEWDQICKIWNTSSAEIYNLDALKVNSDVLKDHLRKCGVIM